VFGFCRKMTDWQHRARLTETLTICTDEHLDPSNQFLIYGYIITTSTSRLLKTLFEDPKARAKGIILHNTKTDILHSYVHWLHTRELVSRNKEGFSSYPELVDLYLLGETLEDRTFCQEVVDAIVDVRYEARKWPGCTVINDVWERTAPESPLRKVMKELWASTLVDKAMVFLKTAPEPGYPKDLILSLLETLAGRSVLVSEATFSGKCCKEVENACREFVRRMGIGDDD
jgi:hypothetical protein